MSTSRALTSELSFKTENKLLKYALVKFGRMKNQLIMFAVFSLLSYPLLAVAALTQFADTDNQNFLILSTIICIISIGGIIILTIVIPTVKYDYFSRKTVVDINYALPISNRQRFWGDFLSGIIPVSVLHMLSIGIGWLIMFLGSGIYYRNFKGATSGAILEAVKAEYSSILSLMFQCAVLGLLILLGIYILTVFACTLSGRGFENWLVLLMLITFLPAVTALLVVMPFINVAEMNIENQLMGITAPISPVMLLIRTIDVLAGNSGTTDSMANIIIKVNPLPYMIFMGIIVAASYFLGTRRNVEKVGEAFAYKPTSPILLGALLFTITAGFCIAIDQTGYEYDKFSLGIAMIILTLIAFLVFELLTKRSFKKLHIGLLKYAGILGGTVIVSVFLLQSDGFGIGRVVPAPDSVKSVEVRNLNTFGMNDYIGMGGYSSYIWSIDFEDSETINTVIEMNRESNTLLKTSGNEPYTYEYFTAVYTLKSGSIVERNVFFSEETQNNMLALSMCPEVKQTKINSFRDFVYGYSKEEYVKQKHAYAKDMLGSNIVSLGTLDLDAVFEAYSKDVMAQTAKQVYENPPQPLFTLEIRMSYKYSGSDSYHDRITEIYVPPHFENLRAVLRNYIKDSDIPKMNFNNREVALMYEGDKYAGIVYDYEVYDVYNGTDIALKYPYYAQVVLADPENNPEYMELINVMIPVQDTRYKSSFIVLIDGRTFFIPNKYFDKAESVFRELLYNS